MHELKKAAKHPVIPVSVERIPSGRILTETVIDGNWWLEFAGPIHGSAKTGKCWTWPEELTIQYQTDQTDQTDQTNQTVDVCWIWLNHVESCWTGQHTACNGYCQKRQWNQLRYLRSRSKFASAGHMMLQAFTLCKHHTLGLQNNERSHASIDCDVLHLFTVHGFTSQPGTVPE